MKFQAVKPQRDSRVASIMTGVAGRIVRRFKGADVEIVPEKDGTEGTIGVKFFTNKNQSVEIGLHGVNFLGFWDDSVYKPFDGPGLFSFSDRDIFLFPDRVGWGQ